MGKKKIESGGPTPALGQGAGLEKKPWADAFLESLGKFGVVSVACRAVSIGRRTAYDERARNPVFAAAWADMLQEAYDTLETMLIKRATTGDMYEERVESWTNSDGDLVTRTTKVHKISDTALIFALKAARPEKYRENVRVEQSGVGGAPIQVEVGPMRRTQERVEELLELARADEERRHDDEIIDSPNGSE